MFALRCLSPFLGSRVQVSLGDLYGRHCIGRWETQTAGLRGGLGRELAQALQHRARLLGECRDQNHICGCRGLVVGGTRRCLEIGDS